MRTSKIGNTTIEYPDEISFCFNPVIINILGQTWKYVTITVRDVLTSESHIEKRAMFKTACFFDISFYMRSFFDVSDFNVDYNITEAQNAHVGRMFNIELDMYNADNSLGNSFQFSTFVIWGAMAIGERYNGDNALIFFKNYPFTVGIYTPTSVNVNVISDGSLLKSIALPNRNVWNINLKGINTSNKIEIELPSNGQSPSVFDHTFDFTFRGLSNVGSRITCIIDDSKSGIYLRWINRHGFYCYWLFKIGEESRQTTNDGEFFRNNMQDYSYKNGYHGGSGRKQRKTSNESLSICAPLVDSSTFDFLYQLAKSPIVDLYMGKDSSGVHRWESVNISVGSYNKTNESLQDFMAVVLLPEIKVQSL